MGRSGSEPFSRGQELIYGESVTIPRAYCYFRHPAVLCGSPEYAYRSLIALACGGAGLGLIVGAFYRFIRVLTALLVTEDRGRICMDLARLT